MKEEPKRLTPTKDTLRELFLKSGNLCAFPNCTNLMMNEKGKFIAQLCHIEGVKKKSARFNPNMSNEERRHFDNLMLMCYPHHIETDDEDVYTVEKMRDMKRAHERRFSAPDRAILDSLKDWTTVDEPRGVTNLVRYNEVLELNLSEGDLELMVTELNEHIDQLRNVPIEVRRFLGAVARRICLMDGKPVTEATSSRATIAASDFAQAHRLDDRTIRDKLAELESYLLGGFDQMHTSVGDQPGISIYALPSGWLPWLDIVGFCDATATPFEYFTDDLDFACLDEQKSDAQ